MAEKLVTKNDLLNKLRAYRATPDDENIQYKKKIEKATQVFHEVRNLFIGGWYMTLSLVV